MKNTGIVVIIIAAVAGLIFFFNSSRYDAQAEQYLFSAMESQMTCMMASGEFTQDENIIKLKKGLGDKPDIHLDILEADARNFVMEVYHEKGKKIFSGTLEYQENSNDAKNLITSRPR